MSGWEVAMYVLGAISIFSGLLGYGAGIAALTSGKHKYMACCIKLVGAGWAALICTVLIGVLAV